MQEIERVEPLGSTWVELRVGVFAPERFRLTRGLPRIEGDRVVGIHSPSVVAEFVAEPGGAVRLRKITAEEHDGRPLPGSYIKRGTVEKRGRDELAALLRSDPREPVPVPGDPDFVARLKARKVKRLETADILHGLKGRRGPDLSQIEEAARAHREATSGSPLDAVADALGVSTATASRWVRMARERGLDVGESGARGAEVRSVDETLREVAEVVKRAEAQRLPIAQAVMRRQDCSESTARRRIREARRQGLLAGSEGAKR